MLHPKGLKTHLLQELPGDTDHPRLQPQLHCRDSSRGFLELACLEKCSDTVVKMTNVTLLKGTSFEHMNNNIPAILKTYYKPGFKRPSV